MSIEAMKQALEALETCGEDEVGQGFNETEVKQAITSLRQAIEQAEKQEPVAIYQYQLASGSWIDQTKNSYDYNVRHGQATVRVVYTAPQPQREWVGLTDDEIDKCCDFPLNAIGMKNVRKIEAKLKSKKT